MRKKSYFFKIVRFPARINLLLLATLVINIGNGMNTIAVSKLVYDKTNSAMAFGGIIILEYGIMFLLQFLSGSVVDRNNPKRVLVICDLLRGALIFSSGLMVLLSNWGLVYLFIILILTNIIEPFYRSASFTVFPEIVNDESKLLEVNSIATMLFQAGQLLGSVLAAPIIFLSNPATALLVNGMTYIMSAIFFLFIKMDQIVVKVDRDSNVSKKFWNDWKELFMVVKKEKGFLAHILLISGDYLSINFFNLMLVPMVTLWYRNNSFYISLFDGGFAVGAMLFAAFVVVVSKKIGQNNSAFIGLLLQALFFLALVISRNPLVTFLAVFFLGAANSFSVTIFNTNLQQRCVGPIKGRVSSMKNVVISAVTIVFVPIISKLHDISITHGLLASSVIIFTYSVASCLCGRKTILANCFLVGKIEIE